MLGRPALAPLLATAAAVLGLAAAHGQDLTNPLSSSQVACFERQLAALAERTAARLGGPIDPGVPSSEPSTLLLATTSPGAFMGLLVSNQWTRNGAVGDPLRPAVPPELHLAFNVHSDVRQELLNPQRPPLPQIVVAREPSASNLVPPDAGLERTVALNPTLGPAAEADLAEINNLPLPALGEPYNGFRESATKPGRGLILDGLTEPCHDGLTAFDRKVFSILERTLRPFPSRLVPPDRPGGSDRLQVGDADVAIYRGVGSRVYRLDVYPFSNEAASSQRLALEITVEHTAEGELTTGSIAILPVCAVGQPGGCTVPGSATVIVYVAPPVFGGHEFWRLDDPAVAKITFTPGGAIPFPVPVDWAALLADTAW